MSAGREVAARYSWFPARPRVPPGACVFVCFKEQVCAYNIIEFIHLDSLNVCTLVLLGAGRNVEAKL